MMNGFKSVPGFKNVTLKGEDTTTSMGVKAAEIAIERAGIAKDDIDFVVLLP
jgi:3-oxoacyl-[acyl-carrier-protein] synthase III